MDGKKLKLMSKDGEYLCPLCLKKGEKSAIMVCQLNLYEAMYQCSSLECHFPTYNEKYYVPPFQRHYLNMNDPIEYPQVFYGPLPYFEGVMLKEDEICTDDYDDEEESIQNRMPEKKVPHEKISSEEVDELLDGILQDINRDSQQVCLENIFAGVSIDEFIPPNHSEPNFNSSENICDVRGESESAGQKTFCSSESSHASGMVRASGEAVSPIKQHLNDREVPNSVGEVFNRPIDVRVSSSTHDISQPCEISATRRSNFLNSSLSARDLDGRMNNAATHLKETLPGSDHSYCKRVNSLPTSFAPFEFTCSVTPKKRKPAGRKRKRRRSQK